jgi:hypothetical protein
LNIIERKREFGSYLGCYLSFVDDDWRYILLDEPLSRYLVMREEELIHLLAVGLKRLAIFVRQVVEGRLDDVILVEVRSVGVEAPFFMLEVVDSPAESSKCVGT